MGYKIILTVITNDVDNRKIYTRS